MKNDLLISKTVVKRNGDAVPFDASKIRVAITKNTLDVRGIKAHPGDISQADRDIIDSAVDEVVERIARKTQASLPIEDIQDLVELALMRRDHALARAYVLYRAQRSEARNSAGKSATDAGAREVTRADGSTYRISADDLVARLEPLTHGLELPALTEIAERALKQAYHGMPEEKLAEALGMAVRERMEMYPDASWLAARLVIADLVSEVSRGTVVMAGAGSFYREGFAAFVKKGIEAELLDDRLGQFDLEKLAAAVRPEQDEAFDYLSITTLYDRYLLHVDDVRIELPQWLLMRVSMGIALNEVEREARAIEFYGVLSSLEFMSSTPTLFNSGTRRAQLSSCYLTTVPDDLEGIYDALKDNALLSKFAGGLGNDWTRVRALGSHIKGTNGKSQGVVPFLKVVNDTAVAVNQGGKRKGAVCAYLESWHLDIEEFLELRKNTGDDRRRTHDMNTANWIPDLFMKRVMEGGDWTLFSPSDVPDLHDLYGTAFNLKYESYEQAAARGDLKLHKKVPAQQLWRKMLGMLFETGHPWITFKDPCNIRSPQQHVGVVHSSNLCTEITLNTSESEIAVCNLGSVNLVRHLVILEDGRVAIDREALGRTISVAMRMLDNVIDINYYSVAKARNANLKHRPVGLGIIGFHDVLQEMRVPYGSAQAIALADELQELVSFYAYRGSNELAKERGRYPSYEGSLWSRGILPQDSVALLEKERGEPLGFEVRERLPEWAALRESIRQYGMRNSNCVAIAPTATISNIVVASEAIQPIMRNLYVKSNLSGEFTVVNRRLVRELKARGLWDAAMAIDLKHFDGSLGNIARVPDDLKLIYATAFEIDPTYLVECAARRQVWIDQAQSLNVYMAGASGKKLDEVYKLAWKRGLKSTYYLRTVSATHVEKSTAPVGQLNAVPSAPVVAQEEADGPVCTMRPGDDGYELCDACQ
ncbi:ribonucleoside-diphosphate reductase subunit alpha [Paraburkholderia sp. J8-2]|uniref:ribonucleoside-diphosphate reductase subunit alpha n=1 Tax=Paraburkholderia sp. J8-2 TaxID=2805440 RepID=UPI002AB62F47|nr:ribonucleoside-diphosphate reductase subunit alpha [Paraburkholderia sp. J8-2]